MSEPIKRDITIALVRQLEYSGPGWVLNVLDHRHGESGPAADSHANLLASFPLALDGIEGEVVIEFSDEAEGWSDMVTLSSVIERNQR